MEKAAGAQPETPGLRLEWRLPSELTENPSNWRKHPQGQQDALADAIAKVGWAGACLYNERTGRLVDGHARRKYGIANGDEPIPVLVGSWAEEDERLILATLDPLAAMAQADAGKLDELLQSVESNSPSIAAMLEGLATSSGILPVPESNKAIDEDAMSQTEHECPKCGFEW